MNFTQHIKYLTSRDVLMAGGKGASLGEMFQAGIPVPGGFVVLSSTFDYFIKKTGLNIQIQGILDQVNHQTVSNVEEASESIQSLILSFPIPEEIEREIYASFDKEGLEYVAVRSSATAEDGAEHARAGQLDSFLNITKDDVIEKVRKCWASLFTPRAIFYRFEKDLHNDHISVAVVVQKMVQSEMAGIAFSVHPVTEDRNQMIIEAGYGLGEAIVSGAVTPDSYVIRKDNKAIDITINHQHKALYKSQNGGNEWKELGDRGEQQILNHDQIQELSEIILHIEHHYAFPCDIEWAYEGGQFFIVQSRPITTLQTISQPTSRKIKLIFTRDHNQWMNEIVDYVFVHILPHVFGAGLSTQITYFNGRTSERRRFSDEVGAIKNAVLAKKVNDNIFTQETQEKFLQDVQHIRSLLSLKEVEKRNPIKFLQEIKDRFIAVYPLYLLALFIPGFWRDEFVRLHGKDGEFIADRLFHSREKSEGLLKEITNFLRLWLSPLLTSKKYPAKTIIVLSQKEVINFLEDDIIPDITIIEQRLHGFIYMDQTITPVSNFQKFLDEKDMIIELDNHGFNQDSLCGTSAYKTDTVIGKVKIIMNSYEMNDFSEGMILVTPMTAPEYLQIMKIASAIITNEGGITCHAAITARELKKPCIIGTKIATQVLHDGDIVEVDTNDGIVRILDRKDNTKNTQFLSQTDWVKYLDREQPPLLFSAFIDPYGVSLQKTVGFGFNHQLNYYKDGLGTFYRSEKELIQSDIYFADLLKNNIPLVYKTIEYEKRTHTIAHELLSLVTFREEDILSILEKFEYILLYNTVIPYRFLSAIERFPDIKNIVDCDLIKQLVKCRERSYYPDLMVNIIKDIAGFVMNKFNLPIEYGLLCTYQEIQYALKKSTLSLSLHDLEQRKHGIYFGTINNEFIKDKNGSYVINRTKDELRQTINHKEYIKGSIGYAGKVQGKVRIINTIQENIQFDDGDILVSINTNPSLMAFLRRAGAIISDEGGTTCHAAIVARELKKPCIIGTKIATQVLHDGDLVEVDAINGIINVLSK